MALTDRSAARTRLTGLQGRIHGVSVNGIARRLRLRWDQPVLIYERQSQKNGFGKHPAGNLPFAGG
jgi:hypothetical protein